MSCLVESVFVFLAACIGIRQCCPISDHNSRSHHQCPQKHQPPSLLPGHIFCPHQRGHRYRLPTDWHCRHWPRQRKSYTQPFYDGLLCTSVSLLIFYTDVCHNVYFFLVVRLVHCVQFFENVLCVIAFIQDRLTYSMTNTEQRCVDMFFIDTANGDIFLRKSFLDISDVTFTVRNHFSITTEINLLTTTCKTKLLVLYKSILKIWQKSIFVIFIMYL